MRKRRRPSGGFFALVAGVMISTLVIALGTLILLGIALIFI